MYRHFEVAAKLPADFSIRWMIQLGSLVISAVLQIADLCLKRYAVLVRFVRCTIKRPGHHLFSLRLAIRRSHHLFSASHTAAQAASTYVEPTGVSDNVPAGHSPLKNWPESI